MLETLKYITSDTKAFLIVLAIILITGVSINHALAPISKIGTRIITIADNSNTEKGE